MDDAPLSVRHVRIVGNTRTSSVVIERALQDAYAASTLGGVARGIQKALGEWHASGLFHGVHVDTEAAGDDGVSLVVSVEEKSAHRLRLGADTSDGSVEGSNVYVKVCLRYFLRIHLFF